MKNHTTLYGLIGLLTLGSGMLAGPVLAADRSAAQPRGSITGRVRNNATGQYLGNARVTVKGTDHVAFTDAFGTYRLVDVPAGPVVLEVFFTDLDGQEISLEVPPGQTIERDVGLTNAARYQQDPGTVKLDPFNVSAQRETDAEAIAINEQRFAPNIKNVLATDALGDVFGSSAGDFLKFLPGLAVDYDNADVSTVSIRGIGAAMTGVLFDGAPIVTGSNLGPAADGDAQVELPRPQQTRRSAGLRTRRFPVHRSMFS